MVNPVNATGWNELLNGNVLSGVLVMYNTYFANWFVAILFFVYQFMLIIKTRNLTLSWITGVIFVSLYAVSIYVKQLTVQIMFLILVIELAGILYLWFWK